MIKNIVFDMGQVLIHFDGNIFMDRAGIKDLEDRKLILRNVFFSLEWSRMDRGSITEEEGCELMCKNLPLHLHPFAKEFTQNWFNPLIPMEGWLAVIRYL